MSSPRSDHTGRSGHRRHRAQAPDTLAEALAKLPGWMRRHEEACIAFLPGSFTPEKPLLRPVPTTALSEAPEQQGGTDTTITSDAVSNSPSEGSASAVVVAFSPPATPDVVDTESEAHLTAPFEVLELLATDEVTTEHPEPPPLPANAPSSAPALEATTPEAEAGDTPPDDHLTADVVALAEAAEAPSSEAQPEDDLEGDLATEATSAESIIERLAALATELESSPMHEGLEDDTLRRWARNAAGLSHILRLAAAGDLAMAEDVMHMWYDAAREMLDDADNALASIPEATPAPAEIDPAITMEAQLRIRATELMGPATQALPRTLHRRMLEAQRIAEEHEGHLEDRKASVRELSQLQRQIESAIAQLAWAYEQRRDMDPLHEECQGLFRQADRLLQSIREDTERAERVEQRMEDLQLSCNDLLSRAARDQNRISQLHSSAGMFGIRIPLDLSETFDDIKEQLSVGRATLERNLFPLDTPDVDQEVQLFESSLATWKRDASNAMNPIRPSVFTRRLDRTEEVRRLVLLAFHLLTDGKTERARRKKGADVQTIDHRGFGKKTVTTRILVFADLIDPTESAFATRFAEEMKDRRGDAERLLETRQVGRYWRYRPTSVGRALARSWLEECLDATKLEQVIDAARKQSNAQRFSKKEPPKGDSSPST